MLSLLTLDICFVAFGCFGKSATLRSQINGCQNSGVTPHVHTIRVLKIRYNKSLVDPQELHLNHQFCCAVL